MFTNAFDASSDATSAVRGPGRLLTRLITALVVVSVHATALLYVDAVDHAQAGEAAVATPQPPSCRSVAPAGRVRRGGIRRVG